MIATRSPSARSDAAAILTAVARVRPDLATTLRRSAAIHRCANAMLRGHRWHTRSVNQIRRSPCARWRTQHRGLDGRWI